MRRVLSGFFMVFGLVLVLGAAFLIVEKSVSQTARVSTRAAIEDHLDQVENSNGGGRLGRMQRRVVEGLRALDRGIFFQTGFDLAAVMPAAGPGWSLRAYQDGDAQRITGHDYQPSALAQNATQSVLARVEKARDDGARLVQVYARGADVIAIRLELDKAAMRALARATDAQMARMMVPAPKDRGGRLVTTLDGIEIRAEPRLTQTPTGATHRADYTHLRFALGKVMQGEVIANVPENQVMDLIARTNMAEVWAALPDAAQASRLQSAGLSPRLPQN